MVRWLKRNLEWIFLILVFLAIFIVYPGSLSQKLGVLQALGSVWLDPERIIGAFPVTVIFLVFMLSLVWLPSEMGKPLKGIKRAAFTALSWVFFLASVAALLVGLWGIHSLPTGPALEYGPGYEAFLVFLTAMSAIGMPLFGKPALWALRLFRK